MSSWPTCPSMMTSKSHEKWIKQVDCTTRLLWAERCVGLLDSLRGPLATATGCNISFTSRGSDQISRGGGHVNEFRSPDELAAAIEGTSGLKHVATRCLGSSLSS